MCAKVLSQGVGFLVKRPLLVQWVQWNNGIEDMYNVHRARRKTNNIGSDERPHGAFYAHINDKYTAWKTRRITK